MLHSPREIRTSRNLLEAAGNDGTPERFYEDLWGALRNGQINCNQVSIRRLFEEFVPDGYEAVRSFDPRFRGANDHSTGLLMEAGDAVDTSAFSNIIGQISYSSILDTYEDPMFIASQLAGTEQAQTQQREIVPGIARLGDKAEPVGENEDYPEIGLAEEWIEVPEKVKDGFIVSVTEEAVWEDKTGVLMQRVNEGTRFMAVHEEKEAIDNAAGITTTYNRNGGGKQATYADTHMQGDFDNLAASNALVDYRNVENVMLLFDAMTDPNTGEPIAITGNMGMLVPTALVFTNARVIRGVGVELGTRSATDPITQSNNPLDDADVRRLINLNMISNQYVKNRTSSDSTWFAGDFQRAFKKRVVWPLQSFTEDRNSSAGFNRDVITRVKVRQKHVYYAADPRYVVKSTA